MRPASPTAIELPVSWAYVDTNGRLPWCVPQIPHCPALHSPGFGGFRWARSASLNPYMGGG